MRIGEVAKQTGLNISNIRFYERKGLLEPEREGDGNYREYSDADIFRLKCILLYRKMGISIDTIYLLLNHKADRNEVLIRQKKDLDEQIASLQGAKGLCELLLQAQDIEKNNIDSYLNYVYQEEEKGNHFAEISEFLDEINDFTQNAVYGFNRMSAFTMRWPWLCKILSAVFWLMLLSVPILHVVDVYNGKANLSIPFLLIWLCIMGIWVKGFWQYRSQKQIES